MSWPTVLKIAFLASLCVALGIITSLIVDEAKIGIVVAILTAAATAIALIARSVFASRGRREKLPDEPGGASIPEAPDPPP